MRSSTKTSMWFQNRARGCMCSPAPRSVIGAHELGVVRRTLAVASISFARRARVSFKECLYKSVKAEERNVLRRRCSATHLYAPRRIFTRSSAMRGDELHRHCSTERFLARKGEFQALAETGNERITSTKVFGAEEHEGKSNFLVAFPRPNR